MRHKIRNAIFKIENDVKNLQKALEEKCIQTLRHALNNGYNNTVQIIHKIRGACFADRFVVHISNIKTLKSVYNAYFHSIKKTQNNFLG